MTKLFLGLLVSSFVLAADIRVFRELDGTVHVTQEIPTSEALKRKILREGLPSGEEVPMDPTVILDQIVNLGQKIWKIIESNQPSVEVKYSYANALPKGVRNSEDLDGFSDLQFRSMRHYGKNLYGAKVYDVTYTLTHRYGGKYEGRGNYLENVTVLPQQVEASWGYSVNFSVEKVGVVNSGNAKDPVASLSMEANLSISTVMKKLQLRNLYQFRGDSARAVGSDRRMLILN